MSRRLALLATIGALLFTDSVSGQRRYVEEEEEQDPSLAMNRAKTDDIFQADEVERRSAVRSKQAPLLDTFRGTTKPVVGEGIWKERGVATMWYDAEDKLISVEVENKEASALQDLFTSMCDEQALY